MLIDRMMYPKSLIRNALIIAILVKPTALVCQPVDNNPVEDVFRVMEIVTGKSGNLLWPGFSAAEFPVMVYDRIDTGWKAELEENDTLYLEDILEKSLSGLPGDTARLSLSETAVIRASAEDDFFKWQEKKKQEIIRFENLPGYALEINAASNPMGIRIFEPLEIEILGERNVYHRLIFSAGNGAGSLRIMNQPCISKFDNSLRVEKLVLKGLKDSPAVIEAEKRLVVKSNNVSIDLKYSGITINGQSYILEL